MTDLSLAPRRGRPHRGPAPRKPRKIFLVVGLVVAAALGVGLFTSLGTNKNTGPPQQGGPVPSFSAARLNGSGTVAGAGRRRGRRHAGRPAVLRRLVHRSAMPSCPRWRRRSVTRSRAGGALARVHVIGVDSDLKQNVGRAFVKSARRRVPGRPRSRLIAITNGDFYFQGDPYAVFVKGDGTISAIVPGPLSPAKFTAEEKKLIPSES